MPVIKSISSQKTTAGIGATLSYMLDSKDRDPHNPCLLLQNLRGGKVEEWIQEFESNEEYRKVHRSDSNVIVHETISFHPDDGPYLSAEVMKALTETYIQHRAKNALVVAVVHHDKDKHAHVHLCISGVNYRTGESSGITKKEFEYAKQVTQQVQRERFPELKHSVVEHGIDKATIGDREYRLKERTGKPTQKELLIEKLVAIFKMAKTKEELIDRLEDSGYSGYERSGILTGILSPGGKKYRFRTLGFEEELKNLEQGKEQSQEQEAKAEESTQSHTNQENQVQENSSSQEVAENTQTSQTPQEPKVQNQDQIAQNRMASLRQIRQSGQSNEPPAQGGQAGGGTGLR